MINNPIYVSLTSISSRIGNIFLVVESIVNQSRVPDKIFLYLSREPYLLDEGIGDSDIPESLLQFVQVGKLEIVFSKNIGPYRKLIPLLKDKFMEDCIIITADDDTIYPRDWLERLIRTSESYPNSIISFRNRYIALDSTGFIPYEKWKLIGGDFYFNNGYVYDPCRVFPTGVGGVLYKPRFFKDIVFDDAFLDVCPYNDDIWFKFVALISGTRNRIVVSKYLDMNFKTITGSQSKRLFNQNVQTNTKYTINNNTQLVRTAQYLRDIYKTDVFKLLSRNQVNQRTIKIKSIPKFPKILPGTMWAITAFFNPAQYSNKYDNYKKFCDGIRRQGLKLCFVELSFGDHPYELSQSDADILVQIRGGEKNILWQKEALLNIALRKLPAECDKVVWLDCDVIFQDDNWIAETSGLLQQYKVVQPFKLAVIMPKHNRIDDIDVENLRFGRLNNNKRYGIACTRHTYCDKTGHPGFAWAARREVLEKCNFYDRLVIGSADVLMSNSFFAPSFISTPQYTYNMRDDMLNYTEMVFKEVRGSVGYASGNLYHLWHGNLKNRKYSERMFILKDHKFNPYIDVCTNDVGLIEWNCNNRTLIEAVNKYFFHRKERSSFVMPGSNLCFYIFKYIKFDSLWNIFKIKLDYIFGQIGRFIEKVSPPLYLRLAKNRPRWAQPVNTEAD